MILVNVNDDMRRRRDDVSDNDNAITNKKIII